MSRVLNSVFNRAVVAMSIVTLAGCAEASLNAMMSKSQLMSEMTTDPDLPAWHDEREKMQLAVGDRVIDKSFDRTFDSMIIALANLGCRVNNMERRTGYITASLPELPPEQRDALIRQGIAEYARAKGYPPSVLDDSGPYGKMMPTLFDDRWNGGLTLTMMRQAEDRTKVKLRFDKVYYPREVDELYKRVWDSVDKQIFLDRATD